MLWPRFVAQNAWRYHAHQWNVDDIMAAALPHHDSPLFTKLVQGLHVEGKPRWSWLTTLKALRDGFRAQTGRFKPFQAFSKA